MTGINFIYTNGQIEWEQAELCPYLVFSLNCITQETMNVTLKATKTSCNLLDNNSGIKNVFKIIQCHVGRKLSGKNPILRSNQHGAHVNYQTLYSELC